MLHKTVITSLSFKKRSYPIPLPFAQSIKLSLQQQAELEKIVRRHTSQHRFVLRARVILMAAAGQTNQAIAAELSVSEDFVRTWRSRWADVYAAITTAETNGNIGHFVELITAALSDRPRPGAPGDFTAYQLCRILAVAQENPMASGYPISHWTPVELRTEVIQRGIVTDISERTIGRLLNDTDIQPHRVRYWEYPASTDSAAFQQEVRAVCETYQQAPQLAKQGVHTVSVDEKTSIQALGAPYPTLPLKSGQPERQETTYERHGTQTMIAAFDVTSGQVLASVGPTRTEDDFCAHIEKVVAQEPQAGWIFVADQLNTHQSESLVEFVAKECRLEIDLGVKGKSGILANMETRTEFLSNPDHRIRFVYTPKHASWLNQIEIWFSILVRRLLKRLRCNSVDELKQHLCNFVDYFNKTMAKPFKWTYQGKPLMA